MIRVITVGLILFLVASQQVAFGQKTKLNKNKVAKIESLVREAMTQSKAPGLSVALISDDELTYANGFGVADLENSIPAKATTVYRLGSLTKPITAVAAMKLSEKQKLDLDAPIQTYCPAFPAKQWPISTRQLLAHLAGIRDYSNQHFLEEYYSTRHYTSINESLDIFKNDPLLYEPGTKYTYSSYGYNVLGCVIEGASGSTYEAYVRENIFVPAGMKQTAVDSTSQIIVNRARGYEKTKAGEIVNAGMADTSNKIPSGGLVSTVEDIARFAIAFEKGQLVNPVTVEQMRTLQKTKDRKESQYALGWRVGERNGMRELFHGGSAAGFCTFLYLLPEKRIGVVLMANIDVLGSKNREDVVRQIADVMILPAS